MISNNELAIKIVEALVQRDGAKLKMRNALTVKAVLDEYQLDEDGINQMMTLKQHKA